MGDFTDPNPTGTASEFSALIDWGDGSPQSAGTITLVSSTATSTTFLISGTHTYADLYGTPTATSAAQTSSTFPLSIHVVGTDGSSINLADTATVTGGPFTVSGRLDPASDSGISNSDDITNVVQPTFEGTAGEPFARISVYAGPVGTHQSHRRHPAGLDDRRLDRMPGASHPTSRWPTVATPSRALAVDATNDKITNTATVVPDLVIDTVGPKVTSVSFDRFQGQIVVTFQDFGGVNNAGSGMDLASVIDAANYQLVTAHHPRVGKYVVNVISDVPGTTVGTQTVTLSINGGKYIKGGWYDLHDLRGQPVDAQRGAGHRRQRAGRRVLRLLPLGEQHPGRELRRPAHGDPPHDLRPLDDHRPGDPGPSPGHEAGERPRVGDGEPEQAAPLELVRGRSVPGGEKAVDKADHHSHPTVASSSRTKAPRQDRTKVVHHTDPALTHLIHQVGVRPAASSTSSSSGRQATAMGALGTLDQALDQLGRDKHSKS